MRRAHWLRGNKGVRLPHAAVWVDTETKASTLQDGTQEHYLWFGWACYQRTRPDGQWTAPQWHRFASRSDFWGWVETLARPRTRLHVYAHNWAFDAPVLGVFEDLPARGWRMTRAIVESPPVIVAWRRELATLELLDTLNWWPMPLRDLGEHVGLPKLPPPPPRASVKRWDEYCQRDVEVIRRAKHEWWAFIRRHELGGYAKTLSGQALRAYRHRFMDHRILIDDNVGACALARHSMMGGRTEAFRVGRVKGPLYLLDVNSMYPAVMAGREYPAILRLFAREPSRRETAKWLREWQCVARARIATDEPLYPVRLNGRLVFPIGTFVTYLTTPDLRLAAERGHLARVDAIALYESAPLFGRYVDELFALRSESIARGDHVHSWMLKLLLNSLFGKFAQRGSVWHEVARVESRAVASWREVDFDTGEVHDFCQFAGVVQERAWEDESHDSHPAIAAHVTAWARRELWSLIEKAGRGNVVYCDTDSVWVNAAGYGRLQKLVNPAVCGLLKHVETAEWLLIHGAKDYRTPARIVCKGVRSNADWVAPNVVIQDTWTGLRGQIELGSLDAPRVTRQPARLLRRYEKGTVNPDGSVSPLALREW